MITVTHTSHDSPRQQVVRAITHQDPDYVPAWYSFFATETRERYGERLTHLLDRYRDDVVFSVLSTFPPKSERPPGWVDEWGCAWNQSPDGVGSMAVDSPLYHSWDRLDWYLENALPGLGQMTHILDRVTKARADNPDRYLVGTTFLGVLERLRALRGTENLLTDLILQPVELATLRDALADEFAGQIRSIAARGADAVLIADDFGTQDSLILSPKHFREFFKPMYARLFAEIHEGGMHAWFHSCGCVRSIIPDLIEIDLDVLHPLQPPCLDLKEIAETFRGQVCFAGAVDVQELLVFGTPGEVEEELRWIIDLLDGPHGGFVLAPTNSIMPDTPFENLEAMCRTMYEYGHAKRAGK
jgi:uroporphyrinogen decarboxylase